MGGRPRRCARRGRRVIRYRRERMPPDEMTAAARRFLDTIRLRRTVRDFSSDPVPDDVIEMAIESASLAPSGANMQPWKFVVVREIYKHLERIVDALWERLRLEPAPCFAPRMQVTPNGVVVEIVGRLQSARG